MDSYLNDLIKAAKGDRVVSTNFLEPNDAASLAAKLRAKEIKFELNGGFPGASRRVLTVFPNHIPKATTSLSTIYFEDISKDELVERFQRTDIDLENVGDIINFQEGLAVVILSSIKDTFLELTGAQEIALADISKNQGKVQQVIVPSLRVDVLGAKAFKVSRSYFAKGIANGKVSVQGKLAGKSSSAELEDEVHAEGLGRFRLVELLGKTKKGNHKVVLEVESWVR